MSYRTIYLQKRGYSLIFRIAIPVDLRHIIGVREFVKSLPTQDRNIAGPIALSLAAQAKQLFTRLRDMAKQKKPQNVNPGFGYTLEYDLDESGAIKRVKIQAEPHEQDAVNSAIRTAIETGAVARQKFHTMPAPTPASESAPAAPKITPATASQQKILHRLSDAIPVWKRLKNPALSTIEVYELAVRRFEGRYPDLHAEVIEKRHVRDYVKWLQAEGLSAKTIEKEHGVIRAILTIAEHEEWRTDNPASGTLLPRVEGKKIRSYKPDECKVIFGSPVFVSGERPIAGKGEAAYWIPLLMLFSGARREEICQLTTDRIKSYEGVSYLAIDPIDQDGRLKTDESRRVVPIHQQLLRMGFLDYVAECVKAGGGQLFPLLKANPRGQYGAKWGDWWRRYIRGKVGITDEKISPAHSFRHLFITECRRLKFRDDYERALVGHTRGGGRKDAHDGYGEHLISSLAEAVNQIDFRGLDLTHLFRTKS